MPLRVLSSRLLLNAGSAAALVVVCGLLVTFGFVRRIQAQAERERATELRSLAEDTHAFLLQGLQAQTDVMRGLSDAFALEPFLSPKTFHSLARQALQRNSSFSGITWVPIVRSADRAKFEDFAHEMIGRAFRIQSAATNSTAQDVYPVFHYEWVGDGKATWGKDLRSSALGSLLERVRATREPAIAIAAANPSVAAAEKELTIVSPVLALSADGAHALSIGEPMAFAVGTCRLNFLGDLFNRHGSPLDVAVLDATPGTPDPERLVYSGSGDAAALFSPEQNDYRESVLVHGGRVWLVRTRPNSTWLTGHALGSTTYLWVFGGCVSALLGGFVYLAGASSRGRHAKLSEQLQALDTIQRATREESQRREEAENLLRSSQQQLHALMENSPSAIFMKDTEGRYLTVNRRFAEMHGKMRDQFVGRSDHDLFSPEMASRMRLSDTRVISSGKPIELEDSLMLANGNHTSIVHKFPLVDEEGKIHGICGIATDISERKRAEADVRESRRQLESLLGQLPGMAFRFINDGQLTPVYVSRGAIGLTGHSARDFIEGVVKLEDVIHAEDRERSKASIAAAVKKRRSFEVEYRIIDRSGRVKWVLERGQGVYDEEGKLLFIEGLAIDITQRKDAEAEKLLVERRLLEGQKLESIGVLAGGIAHDFNNLLTGIIGNANLAAVELPTTSRVQQNLRHIEIASQRAAELCQQMLAYAGKGRFMVHRVELGSLVENTVPLLRASISKRAQLHFDLTPGLPAILADPTQMRQIVMNLVLNASEALGDQDGEIVISTKLARPTAEEFSSGAVLAPPEFGQDFVSFEVRDTGCGMPPETIAKIFDPFFTTKFAGRGLGLAAVQGIIRSHKGGLRVISAPGKGSKFTLLFPVATGPTEAAPPRRSTAAPWRREGLALIVDDEDHVRNVTAGLLHTCGFRTELARDGYEALDLFRAKPQSFDIVVLDMTMPRLSGEETLQLLREVSPDVRVLFMSGYNRREVVDTLSGTGVLSFIQKPFTLEALREQLQVMLA